MKNKVGILTRIEEAKDKETVEKLLEEAKTLTLASDDTRRKWNKSASVKINNLTKE